MLSTRLPWAQGDNPLALAEAACRQSGAALLDLTVSNPTLVGLPYPVQAVAAALAVACGDPQYHPAPLGLPVARQAVSADYRRRGAQVPASAIALTASSSESYSFLFKLLCNPGDVVLVPRPGYPLFDQLAQLEGLRPRAYELFYDGQWRIDFSRIDTEGVRALVVVNPNNPTGSFITAFELTQLGRLAGQAGIPLIVDEVFSDYTFEDVSLRDAVTTVAACPPPDVLTFALGGLSKACGLPQLKMGWVAALGAQNLVVPAMHAFELLADTYLSVAIPAQRALPQLLQQGAKIRAEITRRVARNRSRLRGKLGPDSPCTLLPADAGWCAILRVPQTRSDEAWALELLQRDAVLVQPGYLFDLNVGATLVLSLLPQPETFDEGLDRILARVDT